MFQENKYTKKYWDLINYRLTNPPKGYVEKHHIIPRSLGGADEGNIVQLTAREHFYAHRLLSKITEGQAHFKMMWAVHRMLHTGKYYYSSRTYEKLRTDHILFLKENHHAHRIPGWGEKMSELVTAQWENAAERRKQFSESMKQKQEEWKQDPNYYKEQKRRSLKGVKAMIEKCAKRIEYNGNVYKGWNALLRETGISKHLYNRFYKNGVDPVFRVGKDGVMTKQEIDITIEQFCQHVNEVVPNGEREYHKIFERMIGVGLISKSQMITYFKINNWKL